MKDSHTAEVIIVGAGLAGLACARALSRAGVSCRILEAADGPGGRVRTDEVEGFLLDRGFQVMLPAYPEARRVLNYEELDLRGFYRGAQVLTARQSFRLADPLHHLTDALRSLKLECPTWRDRWFTLLLRKECFGLRAPAPMAREIETEDYLREFGFSDGFIDRFFRPFFGGIFLEKDLRTSASMFTFLFAMFDRAGAALPARGMGQIPLQLAAALPEGCLHLNRAVAAVAPGMVTMADGEVMRASQVVVATSQTMAEKLLPEAHRALNRPRSRSVTCFYFAAHRPPHPDRVIFLDGDGRGPVNNACVLSNISPHYAPEGQHLVSATVLGIPKGEGLESEVRQQMGRWFGLQAGDWRHLRTYQIQDAQPEERQLRCGGDHVPALLEPGLLRAGDYCEDVSINGALISGRRAAESVLEMMGR